MDDVILREPLVYSPTFGLSIDSREVAPELHSDVVEVIYRDAIDGLDSVELVVNNWNNDMGTFKYNDAKDFDPPKRLDLTMGYSGNTRQMFAGEIVTLESRMRGPGQIHLHVRALNRLHGLRTVQHTRVHEGKTDSQIARQIATDLQLGFAGDARAQQEEVAHPYLLQANEYDIVFLLGRARRIGYDLWLDDSSPRSQTLHFKPSPRVMTNPIPFTWGVGLLDATVTLSTAGQTSEVIVRAWDPMQKRTIVERATWGMLGVRGLPDADAQRAIDLAISARREVIVDRPVHSTIEAKVLARQSLESLAKDLAVVRGTVIGTPTLTAGTRAELQEMGRRYSGIYFITQTVHRSGGAGYRTHFVGRLERT